MGAGLGANMLNMGAIESAIESANESANERCQGGANEVP